jgi:hypothetical protein
MPLPCCVPGCDKPRTIKDNAGGRKNYRSRCAFHHHHATNKKHKKKIAFGLSNCEKCAWFGCCHRHRILPGSKGGRYVRGNVLSLCPNCHAAIHGLGSWNRHQVTGAEPLDLPVVNVEAEHESKEFQEQLF